MLGDERSAGRVTPRSSGGGGECYGRTYVSANGPMPCTCTTARRGEAMAGMQRLT